MSAPFIYLFNNLYKHEIIYRYLILWVTFYYSMTFCSTFPALAIENYFRLAPASLWPASQTFFDTTKCGFIMVLSSSSLGISQVLKGFHAFYWRMASETQIWALSVVDATGLSLLLGPLCRQCSNYMHSS